MWMFFNKVFGWHYIQYRDSATSFVARVKTIPNGENRMTCGWTRSHYNAVLSDDGTFKDRSGMWQPLTWKVIDDQNNHN